MLLLKQIFKFIALLNSETSPNQLCSGFALGMLMGFTPISSLFWVAYVVMLLILRINMGAAFLAYAAFKILSFGLDPLFDRLGLWLLLDLEGLKPLWRDLYHMAIIPYTRFYNSVVLGSVVTGFFLTVPLYFLSRFLVLKYRSTVVARFKNHRLWKAFTATKFYGLYVKYREFRG